MVAFRSSLASNDKLKSHEHYYIDRNFRMDLVCTHPQLHLLQEVQLNCGIKGIFLNAQFLGTGKLKSMQFQHYLNSLKTIRWNLTFNCSNWIASYKCIATIAILTRAVWTMIKYGTFRIFSANSNARWSTLLMDTSFTQRTFTINNTFRSTCWWISHELWQTGTYRRSIIIFAATIGSTRIRITCFYNFNWS